MKKITPQTEQKLMRVLEKVAELTTAGDSPSTAIIKAGSGVLRPGEVELVVRAYNVGKTNCQRETGSDILEKTAAFELADSDVVSAALFPTTVKTAAQHMLATAVSADYSQSACSVARQIKAAQTARTAWPAAPAMEKQAHERLDTKSRTRQLGDLQRATRDYEVKRAAHRQAVLTLTQAVDAFGDCFRVAGAPAQSTVKSAASRLHGDAVVQGVFDSMYVSQPGLANIPSAKLPTTKIAASHPVLRAFERVLVCAEDCRIKAAACAAAVPLMAEKQAAFKPVPPQHVFGDSILDTVIEKKADEKQAFLPTLGDMSKKLQSGFADMRELGDRRTDPEPAVNKALYELTDPDHEEQLRQLQAQTSFQELMARDPVLQGYNPNQLADVYGHITQAAPNLATQPVALQPLLRKQLEQGHMDTFDVNDMIKLNNNLQDRFSGMNDANGPAY